MSNPELKSFDRVAHLYDTTRAMPSDVTRTIADRIAAALHSVSATPELLEVGIGTGRIAVPLAEAGVGVTGIDISPKMLGLLREKRRDINVMLAEASQPPLRPASFDGALFVHILHLVPDAEATVRAVLPLVRPGGVILHGQDRRAGGVRGEADALIEATITEITGLGTDAWNRRDRGGDLCAAAVTAGGGSVEDVRAATWTSTATARRMLERLARKDFSSSWRIPDDLLPEIIARVTPMIEKLFGGLDREVSFERSFSLMIGRLPG